MNAKVGMRVREGMRVRVSVGTREGTRDILSRVPWLSTPLFLFPSLFSPRIILKSLPYLK